VAELPRVAPQAVKAIEAIASAEAARSLPASEPSRSKRFPQRIAPKSRGDLRIVFSQRLGHPCRGASSIQGVEHSENERTRWPASGGTARTQRRHNLRWVQIAAARNHRALAEITRSCATRPE